MTACLTVIHALARLIPPSRKRPRGARPTPPCRPWKASVRPVRASPVSETRPPVALQGGIRLPGHRKPPDRDRGRTHPLRRRANRDRYRQRTRHQVDDRTHGSHLRPARHRAHGRGLGTAITTVYHQIWCVAPSLAAPGCPWARGTLPTPPLGRYHS
jgi:hypothetical protein